MSNATGEATTPPRIAVSVPCAVITVSSTRTLETDEGGKTAVELLERHGHRVALRQLIDEDPQGIREVLRSLRERADIDAVVMVGKTGLSPDEQTVETLLTIFDKRLPGFGEIYRWLSYQDIGPAAMLTRATAGMMGRTIVFSIPGSSSSVRRAMERLILPELGRIVAEVRK